MGSLTIYSYSKKIPFHHHALNISGDGNNHSSGTQGLYERTIRHEVSGRTGSGWRVVLMLGIIGGTSLLFSTLPPFEKQSVNTPYGIAEILRGEVIMLMRHQNSLPPHRINYRANLAALAIAGVDRIIAFGSSGSLKPDIKPGSLVIPTDYISMTDIPSIHDHAIEHVRPELSKDMAEELSRYVPEAHYGGIYVQTRGPRIETVAEVSALKKIADVVGMTVASEATLSCELGMEFAALCTVDNYANGLGGEVLTYEHILSTARENRSRTEEIVTTIIRNMG
jgi:5'-methylthioadenosine phosphorylase